MKIRTLLLSGLLFVSINAYADTNKMAGYWQNWYSNNSTQAPVKLTDIPTNYQTVIIAFADLATNGSVSFSVQGSPYAGDSKTFKNDIKTLQSQGRKVLISIGGQNASFNVNNQTQENQFVSSLSGVITAYGFDGVDYDIEHGLSQSNAKYLVSATSRLKNSFNAKGKTLIFTTAPETLDTYFAYLQNGKYTALIKSGLVDRVQVQLYNSGCMPGNMAGSLCYQQGTVDFIVSQVDSTIRAFKAAGIQNAERLYVAGFPSAPAAAGGGYTDPSIIKKALTCLRTGKQCGQYKPASTYPNFNQLMNWSINYDAKNQYSFSKALQ
jgi:chitinase